VAAALEGIEFALLMVDASRMHPQRKDLLAGEGEEERFFRGKRRTIRIDKARSFCAKPRQRFCR